jgi:hypothetical protein
VPWVDVGQLLHLTLGGQVALIGDDVILMVQGQPSRVPAAT